MGWFIGSKQDITLVVNALDTVSRNRYSEPGVIVHVDQGTQFMSWHFEEKIRSVGLLPSFGATGRQAQQHNDEKLLVIDADRTSEPEEMENDSVIRQCDL